MSDRAEPLRRDMELRFAEALQYRGTDAYAAFARLLAAVDRCYDEDLRTAGPDRLLHVRGASAQCRALYDALVSRNEEFAFPKI